jgi:hypothetical protein
MMTISPFALDLANLAMRERWQQAAHAALIAQLPPAERPTWAPRRLADSARLSLANGLRNLAVRLDPTLECESYVAVPLAR